MRALLIGGGRPGLALTGALAEGGHAVRFVTRRPEFAAEIEAAGGEPCIGDPDRVGTLRYALDNVTVLLWLLGPVDDPQLHGPRLQMMLERTIDTTVRGFLYEGTDAGAEIVARMAGYNEIPYRRLIAPRRPERVWADAVLAAIDELLSADRGAEAAPA